MNTCFKLPALTLACSLSVTFTACQKDNPQPSPSDPRQQHQAHHHRPAPHPDADAQSPSKQETKQLHQRLQEYKTQREAADKNCADKIGQRVNIQINAQSIAGQCLIGFQPDPPKTHGKHPPKGHWPDAKPDPKAFSDADKQQHMQQHQAQRQAFDQACRDRVGQQINLKFNDKIIEGKCIVRFQPDLPPKFTPSPTPPSS